MVKKRFSTLTIKIILDVVMVILLLMLYQKRTISMAFHEVTGLVLFGLFVIHNLLNWSWIKAVTAKLFSKSTGARLRVSWIVNLLLFLSMAGIIVTGLFMSKTIPINLGRWFGARKWHYFLSALSVVLMGVHLGFHWSLIKRLTSKIPFPDKTVSVVIGTLIIVGALVWGCYTLFTGSFARWISGPFTTPTISRMGNIGKHSGEFGGHPIGERPDTAVQEGQQEDQQTGENPVEGRRMFPGEGRRMNRGEFGGRPIGERPDTEAQEEQQGDEQTGENPAEGRRMFPGEGKRMGPGAGRGMGMDPRGNHNMGRGIGIVNILTVIATYASQMIVFAFLTVLLLSTRKRRDNRDEDTTTQQETPNDI